VTICAFHDTRMRIFVQDAQESRGYGIAASRGRQLETRRLEAWVLHRPSLEEACSRLTLTCSRSQKGEQQWRAIRAMIQLYLVFSGPHCQLT
jgi:hypothetical protein